MGQRHLFIIADRVRLTYKKLDENRHPSNYPTRQAVLFEEQQWPSVAETIDNSDRSSVTAPPLWNMDDISTITNVVAGYVANEAETAFELYVVCPNGTEENEWELLLSTTEVRQLITTTPEEAAETIIKKVRSRRVKIRRDVEKKEGTNDQ